MRQAVATAHAELGEQGLRQILTDVIEEVKLSIDKDINGADLLFTLLNAPWLQSLLKVYECLRQYQTTPPTPVLTCAAGLSRQVLAVLRSLAAEGSSPEARELYSLLRLPHFQALLSAHDTVAQKDFEPVLPPMPDHLAEDEEAMRIVCLVKNQQPLRGSGRGIRSRWDTLRRLTMQRLIQGGALGARGLEAGGRGTMAQSQSGTKRGSRPSPEVLLVPPPLPPRYKPMSNSRISLVPPPLPPRYKPMSNSRISLVPPPLPPRYKPMNNYRISLAPPPLPPRYKPMSNCRICQTNVLWEERLNRSSSPSLCSSVFIDDVIEELDSSEDGQPACTLSPFQQHTPPLQPWTLTSPSLSGYYSPASDHHRPGTPARLRSYSPHVRTAPPSPMLHRRVKELPRSPLAELAKQQSLDELRSTVKQATSSMESSTNDVRLLGQKMAAATERMSESVQDNAQALALLAAVVDRLQALVAANGAADSPVDVPGGCSSPRVNAEVAERKHTPCHLKGSIVPRPPLSQQARCVASCSSPSFGSSSLSGSSDGPTAFQGTSFPRLSNGLSEAAPEPAPNHDLTYCHSNQRKKKKKKKKKKK